MANRNFRENLTVTIADTGSLSGAARIKNTTVVGLVMPAEWDAAGVGLLVSYDDGTTYVQLRVIDFTSAPPYGLDEFEILAADVPTAESVFIPLDPAMLLGATHVKVQSQTAGVPVAQSPARSILIVIRDIQA